MFLDSIAYFLLLGHTEGIETNYRKVMHAKREIPVSNCPGEIENLLYASGGFGAGRDEEEQATFRWLTDKLDEQAAPYEIKKPQAERVESRFEKKLRKGICGGTWYRVDTDGKFRIGNEDYIIEDNAAQYQPVKTEYGDYYAMDMILFSDSKFYDMNYDEVTVYRIGGFVPYENFTVGAET